MQHLLSLNAGVKSDFSQVGKVITVYPPSAEIAVRLAARLHRLTAGFPAPVIPYDKRLRERSNVYYRYGAFAASRTKVRGKFRDTIRGAGGRLVIDRRQPGSAAPPWLNDPFRNSRSEADRGSNTPLETDYRSYIALVQRGRGGTYRATDISSGRSRPCIIKEGRRHGEADLWGFDGYSRVKREAEFLRSVAKKIAAVPLLKRTFRANGEFYLVEETIRGRLLSEIIAGRQPISRTRILRYCASMVQILADIHAAGWTWRDCKPANFICEPGGNLRPIDFEWACRISEPEPLTFMTPGYIPRFRRVTSQQIDFYALSSSLMVLITRKDSPTKAVKTFGKAARKLNLPRRLIAIVRSLRRANSKPELLQFAVAELKKLENQRPSARNLSRNLTPR
jgi:serine/threonine protein kinase